MHISFEPLTCMIANCFKLPDAGTNWTELQDHVLARYGVHKPIANSFVGQKSRCVLSFKGSFVSASLGRENRRGYKPRATGEQAAELGGDKDHKCPQTGSMVMDWLTDSDVALPDESEEPSRWN
ncbi:hypothetical protein PLEOSDRAFT_1100301 [Pleurotus ostreatus PC15]|uniref:Uncharacterized protein n=1 Tax=Pleurotus ostreatus (strain PC15) TaxID=1137138 RepID=A0A067P7A6_PLEO1|nr:hypothetical protein PLEOSDRAFT_1100301 [Pleurotus ostreatus PC15]